MPGQRGEGARGGPGGRAAAPGRRREAAALYILRVLRILHTLLRLPRLPRWPRRPCRPHRPRRLPRRLPRSLEGRRLQVRRGLGRRGAVAQPPPRKERLVFISPPAAQLVASPPPRASTRLGLRLRRKPVRPLLGHADALFRLTPRSRRAVPRGAGLDLPAHALLHLMRLGLRPRPRRLHLLEPRLLDGHTVASLLTVPAAHLLKGALLTLHRIKLARHQFELPCQPVRLLLRRDGALQSRRRHALLRAHARARAHAHPHQVYRR
mmetsp:Transcript_54318/g.130109  ORF Transcript_54318/g.130109 Transcript_54318/m.130109 type:complete len:265 (-) Transcript_54318:117-911(-)